MNDEMELRKMISKWNKKKLQDTIISEYKLSMKLKGLNDEENEKLQDEIKNLKEQVRQLKNFGEEQVKLNTKQYHVIKSFQLKQ